MFGEPRLPVPDPPADCVTPNVMQCEYCGGPIDRLAHLFQCRCCFSIGDFNTGIMTGPHPDTVIPDACHTTH
jgi:hypothetical protein